jgi:hypothetical protein
LRPGRLRRSAFRHPSRRRIQASCARFRFG